MIISRTQVKRLKITTVITSFTVVMVVITSTWAQFRNDADASKSTTAKMHVHQQAETCECVHKGRYDCLCFEHNSYKFSELGAKQLESRKFLPKVKPYYDVVDNDHFNVDADMRAWITNARAYLNEKSPATILEVESRAGHC